ncbi:MAG: 3-phosphoshikimate 1-carboxyvinyltransferase, partial [Lentisphaerae bacterium]
RKTGAGITELPDGMIITPPARLSAAQFESYHDHRVAMALAVLATALPQPSTITNAECHAVTIPEFPQLMQNINADLAVTPETK